MKLSSVRFLQQVHVPGVGDTAELTSQVVALEYDRVGDVVRIGNDGIEVPRSQVRQWRRDRDREPPQTKVRCEVCAREFNNANALGGHRARTGHVSAA